MSLVAGVLLIFTGCNSEPVESAAEEKQRVPVRVQTLTPENFTDYGEYYGEVEAVNEARLVAVQGGRVNAIHVAVGDSVVEGQSLARIEADKVISQYETAVLNEEIAREAYRREQRFMDKGLTSQVAIDNAHLAWLQSRTRLLEAEKAREGALAVSPLDGIVVARHMDLYDELAPGSPTLTVADTSRMKVTVGVPESDMATIRELHSAEIRVNSLPERVWEGRPVSISRKRSERSLTFEVELLVDNPDGALLSGNTARVRLPLREMPEEIVVPSHVLQTRGAESYVMTANSTTVRRVPVTIGPSSDTHTVISTGLNAGDQIITEGINQVGEGSLVRILQ
jgi:RND family efflux transporter MFP subunit